MPDFLTLRGRNALSEFRLNKLTQTLKKSVPALDGIAAEYWHFIQVKSPLQPPQRKILDRLLTYGPAPAQVSDEGNLLLVVPRLGTISPWASKATDIAHSCGLDTVERIERGLAYYFSTRSGNPLDTAQQRAVMPLIHDRMTESVLDSLSAAKQLFQHVAARPLTTIGVMRGGRKPLERANFEMGLALSDDEIDYLLEYFGRVQRDPTDVELMMFAQANSEHCRHKIFNAQWIVDGSKKDKSLFGMIRHTHAAHPTGTVVAYADNASVIEGSEIERFYPDASGTYRYSSERTNILMKVETHNHPTAIAPFEGAATGSGGEIRDEGATGRGSKPKAGLTGFSVSHLRIPGFEQPWEESPLSREIGKPGRIVSALDIMIDGPIGGAAFNNEFGRPNICGYFRTFEQAGAGDVAGRVRGYHKPIMIAGGLGNVRRKHVDKSEIPVGAKLIVLGGPAMLIGLGGGAASSVNSGASSADLDFASVQRGNPEIQRRAQEVIDRCTARWNENPILLVHDVGAGGLSNAVPEAVAHTPGRGAVIDLNAIPNDEPGMSPMELWCNESQERYVLCIDAQKMDEFAAICRRERCPFAVIGEIDATGVLVVEDRKHGTRPVDLPLEVLLGKAPKMLRDVKSVAPPQAAFDTSK